MGAEGKKKENNERGRLKLRLIVACGSLRTSKTHLVETILHPKYVTYVSSSCCYFLVKGYYLIYPS